MGTADSPNNPSVPMNQDDPNTRAAEPQHLEAPPLQATSSHRALDSSGTTESSRSAETRKCREDISQKQPQGDGESRVATLRRAIEVKEKESTIVNLKEQLDKLRTIGENSKVAVEVLGGKDAEITALKEEVQRLEKAHWDACEKHAKVEHKLRTLKKELKRYNSVGKNPNQFEVDHRDKDVEITAPEDQVQQPNKPRNDEQGYNTEDSAEHKALCEEVDRLRKTETNSKVAMHLLEQAAKELLFLRDEVVALRKRTASPTTAGSYLMEGENADADVLSLTAEVRRLREVEQNSHAAADMLEEIMSRADSAADVLHEMMSRRPKVPEKDIDNGGD